MPQVVHVIAQVYRLAKVGFMRIAVRICIVDFELQYGSVLVALVDHFAVVIHIGYPEREHIRRSLREG